MFKSGLDRDLDSTAGPRPGWSYDEVLPYFRRAEDSERGEDAFSTPVWNGLTSPSWPRPAPTAASSTAAG
ncbi:hypothetical protein O1G22_02965 [Streptomyces camelliae]|uniref:Uncharacterized protein n=1 Tax=Streptomyces camelliae TaxID=3004093 RepID=A0ABY7PIE2_9ACTN|nr:hypothetical protein [Streptomyces sp. HUAS 2-6]WBO69514.1 hypothetical protein O1G22_02965 [Streptomyces sp. HUAS 2-6]